MIYSEIEMSSPTGSAMDRQDWSNRAIAFKLIGIGWYVAFCLFSGAIGGFFLDRHLDTSPLFTLLLLTFGLFIAFYGIYRMIRPLMKEENKTDKGAD